MPFWVALIQSLKTEVYHAPIFLELISSKLLKMVPPPRQDKNEIYARNTDRPTNMTELAVDM